MLTPLPLDIVITEDRFAYSMILLVLTPVDNTLSNASSSVMDTSGLDPDWNRECICHLHRRELVVGGHAINLRVCVSCAMCVASSTVCCGLFAHHQTTHSCFKKLCHPEQSSLLQARDKTKRSRSSTTRAFSPTSRGSNHKKHKGSYNSATPYTSSSSKSPSCTRSSATRRWTSSTRTRSARTRSR